MTNDQCDRQSRYSGECLSTFLDDILATTKVKAKVSFYIILCQFDVLLFLHHFQGFKNFNETVSLLFGAEFILLSHSVKK